MLSNNSQKIKVLSYNVMWEAMTGRVEHCQNGDCLRNVSNFVKNNAPYDFLLIQEASNWKTIIGHLDMKYIVDKIGPEEIITLWDKYTYELDDENYYLFGRLALIQTDNRPIQILFFKQNICLINLHADHDFSVGKFDQCVKNMISGFDLTIQEEFLQKIKTYDIIMGGDFNNDLVRSTTFFVDPYFNIQGGRNLYGKTLNKTCCGLFEERNGRIFDHILFTIQGGKTKIGLPVKPASDHYPIISFLPKPASRNIGFDFDGVIHSDVGFPDPYLQRHPKNMQGSFTPFNKIIQRIKLEHKFGNKIWIITARSNNSYNIIKSHLELYHMSHLISGVKFSDGRDKFTILNELDINAFYDDSCCRINELYPKLGKGSLRQLYLVYPEFNTWKMIHRRNETCRDLSAYIDTYIQNIRILLSQNNHRFNNPVISEKLRVIKSSVENSNISLEKLQKMQLDVIGEIMRDISGLKRNYNNFN
jgi:hypothetical protein